jgi:hypothetical protein
VLFWGIGGYYEDGRFVKAAASGILNGENVGTSCGDNDFLESVWYTLVLSGSHTYTWLGLVW